MYLTCDKIMIKLQRWFPRRV